MSRVVIVGHGEVDADTAEPWGVGDVELWGVNEFPPFLDESLFSRWFQLHSPEYMRRHWAHGWQRHEGWLRERHPFPIYMQRAYRKYPESKAFPRDRIVRELPRGAYQTVSFSWLVAYAIIEGFDEIALWGINLGDGEPLAGRACVEYWLGVAEGRGIKTTVTDPTDLFTSEHLARYVSRLQYAYDDEPALELGNGWRDVRHTGRRVD